MAEPNAPTAPAAVSKAPAKPTLEDVGNQILAIIGKPQTVTVHKARKLVDLATSLLPPPPPAPDATTAKA